MISNAASRPRMQMMSGRAEVMGNHRMAPNDFIEIRAFDYEHFDIYLGGIYQVISVEHNWDSRGWITTYDVLRQGQPFVNGNTQVPIPNGAVQGNGLGTAGAGAYTILSDQGNIRLGPAEKTYNFAG